MFGLSKNQSYMDVQSKLRLVLGSVKDQASVSKAMIYRKDGHLSDIDIAILRATSHDEHPIDDKQLREILFLVLNSSPSSISIPYLSQKISNRLRKTKNHFVALKTLLLVHRLLRGGDRKFEQDFRNSHLNGQLEILRRHHHHHHLNHNFFLHNYASFIEERMSWFINQAGKLEPQYDKSTTEIILHGLPKLQLFLDQVLNCSSVLNIISPSDSLTRAAVHNILKETLQVYGNFCEGVATLANSFFDLKDHAIQALAFKLLKKACRQSCELSDFFQKYNRVIGSTSTIKMSLKFPTAKIITIDHVLIIEQYVNDNMGGVSSSISTVDDKSVISREDSEIPEELIIIGTSSTTSLFSCKLETQISTEWVLFDD